jgi:hypothetical protein
MNIVILHYSEMSQSDKVPWQKRKIPLKGKKRPVGIMNAIDIYKWEKTQILMLYCTAVARHN